MFIWHEETRKKARIEIIPMIDVMMFLLVFFVLISLHVIPALGLKTQLPGSTHSAPLEPSQRVVVTLGEDGRMMMDGQDITLADLPAAISRLQQQHKRIDVVVNGDKGVDMQRLIDVMDAVKDTGITNIAIAAGKK
jgi:biopolymer transport protein ExbD